MFNLLVGVGTLLLGIAVAGQTPLPQSDLVATGVSCYQNNQLIYMIKLKLTS